MAGTVGRNRLSGLFTTPAYAAPHDATARKDCRMNRSLCRRLLADETGANSIEYGLLAMVIGVALIAIFMSTGEAVDSHYEAVRTDYADAANNKEG